MIQRFVLLSLVYYSNVLFSHEESTTPLTEESTTPLKESNSLINPQTVLGYICSPDVTNVSHAGPGRHTGEPSLVASDAPAPGLQLHQRERLRAATRCAASCVPILTP